MQDRWKKAFCRQLGDNSGHAAFFSQLSLTLGYFPGFSWEKKTQLCFSYSTFCQMIQRPGNSRETGALPFPWLWSGKMMPCLFQHKVYLVIATYSLFIIRKQLKSNERVRTFPWFHLVFSYLLCSKWWLEMKKGREFCWLHYHSTGEQNRRDRLHSSPSSLKFFILKPPDTKNIESLLIRTIPTQICRLHLLS